MPWIVVLLAPTFTSYCTFGACVAVGMTPRALYNPGHWKKLAPGRTLTCGGAAYLHTARTRRTNVVLHILGRRTRRRCRAITGVPARTRRTNVVQHILGRRTRRSCLDGESADEGKADDDGAH